MPYYHQVSGLATVKSYVVDIDADMHVQEYYFNLIKVVGPNFYAPDDSKYQATIGDYDLDCKCGYGYTVDEAKQELMARIGW